jgi:hypothetical protein
MPTLTSDQVFKLAQAFHDLAIVIGNYRFDNWDDLTPAERKQLEDLQFDVLNDSTKFNALSISIELDNLQSTLDRIDNTTARMKESIQHIKDVGRIINIATAAVTLGAAIVSGNPQAIAQAVAGAAKAVGN